MAADGPILVREMTPADETFVAACARVDESAEVARCGARRLAWLKERAPDGVRSKVALLDGRHAGFLFAVPIEICPWGPLGENLLVVPCLYVAREAERRGVGRALLEAAEEEAALQGRAGVVAMAHGHEAWFMPPDFFADLGYEVAARRGIELILWKLRDDEPDVEPPRFLDPRPDFHPVPGKVVVDLFWNRFCLTSGIEAQRVREVVAEFPEDDVVLREHAAEDREVFERYQIPRGIYIQGHAVDWGYEAPRDGLRQAIEEARQARRLRI